MDFCENHGIKRHFSSARTPQKNGERKNIIVREMAKTMLKDSKLRNIFLVQVVHTKIHILNKGMLIRNNDKNPYELWKRRPTNVKKFRVFGSKCYMRYYVMFPHWMFVMLSWANHICESVILSMSLDPVVSLLL
jgi:transposase InsO family protein